MKGLVVCLLLVCLLAAPVSAVYGVTGGYLVGGQYASIGLPERFEHLNVRTFTYTADPDSKINIITFDIPINTEVNFTLYYGSGSSVAGWMRYRINTVLINSLSEVSIGGNTYQEIFIDPLVSGYSTVRHIQFSGYATNDTTFDPTGFAIYAQGYGTYSNEIAYYAVPNLPSNLIYRIDVTSDQPITVTIETLKTDYLASRVALSPWEMLDKNLVEPLTAPIQGAIDLGFMVVGVVWSLLYWMRVIFVDNLILTVCLYFMGTMAYCANTSRNIFEFYRKFFGLQRKLFEFIGSAFYTLVQILVAIKNLVPGLKWI